jgi:hypothetical protein
MRRRLFAETSTANVFLGWHEQARADVAALASDTVLTSSLEGLEDLLVARYRFDPLVLHWDLRIADPYPSTIDLDELSTGATTADHPDPEPSAVFVRYVPFSGAAGLFDMSPSDPPSEPVYGSVREPGLALYWVGVDLVARSIKADFDRQEENLKAWVSAVNRDVETYKTELRRIVRAALKDRLDKLRALADVLAEIGIPLRQHGVSNRTVSRDARRHTVGRAQEEFVATPRRGRGRPPWTRALFEERWLDRWRLTPPPRTFGALAKHFRGLNGEVGRTGDYLRRLRTKFPE